MYLLSFKKATYHVFPSVVYAWKKYYINRWSPNVKDIEGTGEMKKII